MSVKSVLLASTVVAGCFALGMSARASTLLLAAGGGEEPLTLTSMAATP
jgi:hypothetical protein